MLWTVNMWLKVISRNYHAVNIMTKNEQEIQNAADNMVERYGQDALREVELRILELESRNQQEAVQLWREIKNRVELLVNETIGIIKH